MTCIVEEIGRRNLVAAHPDWAQLVVLIRSHVEATPLKVTRPTVLPKTTHS